MTLKQLERALRRAERAYDRASDKEDAEHDKWYKKHRRAYLAGRKGLYDYHIEITRHKEAARRRTQPLLDEFWRLKNLYHAALLEHLKTIPYDQWLVLYRDAQRRRKKLRHTTAGWQAADEIKRLKKCEAHYQRLRQERDAEAAAKRAAEEALRQPIPFTPTRCPAQCPRVHLPQHVLDSLDPPDWLFEEGLQF